MTPPPDTLDQIRRWVHSLRPSGEDCAAAEPSASRAVAIDDPQLLDALCELVDNLAGPTHRAADNTDLASAGPAFAVEELVERLTGAMDERLDALATRIVDGVAGELFRPLQSELQSLAQFSQSFQSQADSLLETLQGAGAAGGCRDSAQGDGEGVELSIASLMQPAGDAAEEIERLRDELASARREIEDLRQQNEDLASQVARHQVTESGQATSLNFDAESLSWEERKERILAQLEADDLLAEQEAEAGMPAEQRLEVQRIIDVTAREIARRDREIQELRTIVEEQSQARGEVAIGAAAIAQMLDVDPLIEEERKKLRRIQEEWEEKLRQAEIDLSMERAQLARQRRELESEKEELKAKLAALQAEATAPTGRRRRWLDHLGLRDDKEK